MGVGSYSSSNHLALAPGGILVVNLLAVLTAYLEDRPCYVFDEWAADQDPVFKRVFHTELLPNLRARGKAVVVISRDDQYFHLADRCLRLAHGRLTELLPAQMEPQLAQQSL